MSPGARRLQALALTASLLLALGSAAWHHDHRVDAAAGHSSAVFHEGDIVSPGPGRPAAGVDGCPICLSQRLLGQADVDGPASAVAPVVVTGLPSAAARPRSAPPLRSRSARAPPAA